MPALNRNLASQRWNAEYREGRYADEPPIPFVEEIISVLGNRGSIEDSPGLYIGCGNGRNYVPLIDAGLELYGLDLSNEALRQIAERRPDKARYLLCDDFRSFHSGIPFGYIIAIQVFQHGNQADVNSYFARVAGMLKPGGFFFLRVNSSSTQIYYQHEVIETNEFGGFTIKYLEGPKQDLPIHFYSREELMVRLAENNLSFLIEPQEILIARVPPETGYWAQWETICEKQ